MTLSEVKLYLRVDHDDEDTLITSLLAAAENYIQKTTGKTQVKTGTDELGVTTYAAITTDELYNLCVKIMVAHWYENRAIQSPSATNDFSFSAQALINHISLCGDYL